MKMMTKEVRMTKKEKRKEKMKLKKNRTIKTKKVTMQTSRKAAIVPADIGQYIYIPAPLLPFKIYKAHQIGLTSLLGHIDA